MRHSTLSLTHQIHMSAPVRKSKSFTSELNKNIDEDIDDHLPHIDEEPTADKQTKQEQRRVCICMPDGMFLSYWELWITIILLATSVITPLNLAFSHNDDSDLIVNFTIDFFFLIDIMISFNSAFYNQNMELIQDRKVIAKKYIRGWFPIDLLAIIPFDFLVNASDFNQMFKVARFGRLYKLIKLTRLLRILKIMKDKSSLIKYLNDILKIGLGFERLFFFILMFFILCHLVSCFFIIVPSIYDDDYAGTWMEAYTQDSFTSSQFYTISFYWTIQTITTVGYGDISMMNISEKSFATVVMIIGVFSFSFANGSLASIIQNYDHANASYQDKLTMLNKI